LTSATATAAATATATATATAAATAADSPANSYSHSDRRKQELLMEAALMSCRPWLSAVAVGRGCRPWLLAVAVGRGWAVAVPGRGGCRGRLAGPAYR